MKIETIRPLRGVAAWAAAFALTALAPAADAQINCAALPQWSATAPPVNQWHVFCGEWDAVGQRPKGFHSQPNGLTPAAITITQIGAPNAQGVYAIQWEFTAHPNARKFSTMFPDTCTQDQVIRSAVWAANNPQNCPQQAPAWAQCGPSRPPMPPYQAYCSGTDNTPLTIAFGLVAGNVNTAFPLQ